MSQSQGYQPPASHTHFWLIKILCDFCIPNYRKRILHPDKFYEYLRSKMPLFIAMSVYELFHCGKFGGYFTPDPSAPCWRRIVWNFRATSTPDPSVPCWRGIFWTFGATLPPSLLRLVGVVSFGISALRTPDPSVPCWHRIFLILPKSSSGTSLLR